MGNVPAWKNKINHLKSFKINNKSPLKVRNLLRQKMKMSKKDLETDSAKIIKKTQSDIVKIDNKLKASYAK